MSSTTLERELAVALELGRAAGRTALAEQSLGLHLLELREKEGEQGPVTRVDFELDRFLVQALAGTFPDDAILAEESGGDGRRLVQERCWMIDPIDGTSDYARGALDWCILIGLVVRGVPALGVLVEPARDRITYGRAPDFGGGAYASVGDEAPCEIACSDRRSADAAVNDSPGHEARDQVLAPQGLRDSRPVMPGAAGPSTHLRMVSSWSRRTVQTDAALAAMGIDAANHLRVGSTGVKLGMIARGEAEVYPHIGARTQLWDTAAPQAILSSAGGRISDLRGLPLTYLEEETRHLHGLLASTETLHRDLALRAQAAVRRILG